MFSELDILFMKHMYASIFRHLDYWPAHMVVQLFGVENISYYTEKLFTGSSFSLLIHAK